MSNFAASVAFITESLEHLILLVRIVKRLLAFACPMTKLATLVTSVIGFGVVHTLALALRAITRPMTFLTTSETLFVQRLIVPIWAVTRNVSSFAAMEAHFATTTTTTELWTSTTKLWTPTTKFWSTTTSSSSIATKLTTSSAAAERLLLRGTWAVSGEMTNSTTIVTFHIIVCKCHVSEFLVEKSAVCYHTPSLSLSLSLSLPSFILPYDHNVFT
mmetsp:Transcript_51540/g.85397  ORF Transcript_51540/g.85397 Transcript_51540/m.85397 type:complete len:216 (-) Transcript_51540:48-695(-)